MRCRWTPSRPGSTNATSWRSAVFGDAPQENPVFTRTGPGVLGTGPVEGRGRSNAVVNPQREMRTVAPAARPVVSISEPLVASREERYHYSVNPMQYQIYGTIRPSGKGLWVAWYSFRTPFKSRHQADALLRRFIIPAKALSTFDPEAIAQWQVLISGGIRVLDYSRLRIAAVDQQSNRNCRDWGPGVVVVPSPIRRSALATGAGCGITCGGRKSPLAKPPQPR